MKTTCKNCKTLILADRYEYENMMGMLDLFMLLGRITQEEYLELTGLMLEVEPPIVEEAEPIV